MKLQQSLGIVIVASTLFGSSISHAYNNSDIIVRAGVTTVSPQEDSGFVELNGSTLSLSGGSSKLNVDDDTQLGLTVSYVIDNNWAVELLAATPFKHTASGSGELAGLDIAEVKQLPPTLSAIYYFDTSNSLKPYLGAGINYTVFFDEKLTNEADSTLSGLGLTGGDVELEDSWGLALQVGLDYEINNNWLVNASVRWIDINTEAEIVFDNGNKITADVEIDPIVYTISVGYRF